MPHLFSPLTIRDITLRNRIGVSPMCMYSYEDGLANDWTLAHLGARAAGGVGLVISEAAAVEARGRISPDDLGIWSDAHIDPLARVTRFIKSQGAVAGIQLAHAGRKASSTRPWDGGAPLQLTDPRGWQVVGPSPLAFSPRHQTPEELTLEGIRQVQAAFVDAARRALQAGFEWLELHGAHGYLIHSFLSPWSNHRADAYGGSFDNRIRFCIETVQAARAVWPERLPFTVRISGTDWIGEEGWTLEESVELAKRLKAEGVDLVDCSSSGNAQHAKPPVGPGYQVHIAEAVRCGAEIHTAAVGLITTPEQADAVIREERADVVLLGRALLRDPHWALRAAKELGHPAPVPPQYLRAF